jgi:hypothetical protein
MLYENTAAYALTIGVFVSCLFTFVVIYFLMRKVSFEEKMSQRDAYNVFIFLKESEPVIREYFERQQFDRHEKE